MIDGLKVETGWMSEIIGIVADKPNKIRGYRTDLLVFEEAGSWRNLAKAYVQSEALVGPPGLAWGLRLVGGTSGDTKEALDGLKSMFYNPESFGILPFRHNYTLTGETSITSFFVPCTKIPKNRKRFLEHRGFVDTDKVKEWQLEERAKKINTPDVLMLHCAEFPFTDQEAFSAGVINKFNKLYITEQLTNIRALHKCPPIDVGWLEYTFKDKKQTQESINGFIWKPYKTGKVKILEHPLWTLPTKRNEDGDVEWVAPSERINNLYVIGIDGIDIGASQTSEYTKNPSDFCAVVLKRAYGTEPPKVVAIYKDRPQDIRECYKIAIRLALYYNAMINVEATRMSIVPWARTMGYIKWFMRRPRATLSESLRNTNKLFGTPATAAIIAHQTDLIADFINDNWEEMWFDEMLDELNNYTDDNKRRFDIVAAFGMSLLANEELEGRVPKQVEVYTEDNSCNIGYYTDSDGRKRWGVIPNKKLPDVNWNNDFGLYVNYGYRTTDTRFYTDIL